MIRVIILLSLQLLAAGSCLAHSDWKPGQTYRDCDVCPEMVVLPPGKFMMGAHPSVAESYSPAWRQEEVTDTIAVGKFEVLVEEYYACVDDDICRAIKTKDTFIYHGKPAHNLSWNSAKTYVDWLAKRTNKPYRMLNEKEWEYAARAGTDSVYWWGDEFQQGMAICNTCFPEGKRVTISRRVGDKILTYSGYAGSVLNPIGGENVVPPNPFGLYFMLGNAQEWTSDCHQGEKPHPAKFRPTAPNAVCDRRILRGGRYSSYPSSILPGLRYGALADSEKFFSFKATGVRVALTLE